MRAPGWEKLVDRARLEALRLFDFLGMDAYNVTKKTSVH